jgi:hypothetical protein
MKNLIPLFSFVLAPLLLFPPIAKSQSALSTCSAASLSGPYEVTFSGFGNPGRDGTATGNASKVPSAAVGVLNFDGAGNMSVRYTFAEGGFLSTATLVTPDVGTYTVNGDCTGVFYDTTIATQYNMVLIGGGTEMFGVLANYTPAWLDLKKQNVPAGGCTNTVLAANYAFKLSVSDSPGNASNFNPGATHEVAEGVLTFDGLGKLSASYTLNNADVVTVVKGDTGTYAVNSDCTGSFTDVTAGIDFNIVIINGGTELFAIQSDTGYVSLLHAKTQ